MSPSPAEPLSSLTRKAALSLALALAALACKDPPAPAAPTQPLQSATAQPPPAPAQAAVPAAPARDPAQWGWFAPAAAAAAVDVLLWAPAPGRTAAEVDGALARFVAAVRSRATPPDVWTVCTEGQLRAVARFANHDPTAAEAAVQAAWQAAAPPGLAVPVMVALPPGNRARVAFAITHLQGEVAATRRAESLLPGLQAAMKGHARVALAGAVRPALFADVLTRTVKDRHVDLPLVAAAAAQSLSQGHLAVDDEVARQAALQAFWQKPTLQPALGQGDTPVALSQLLALRRGVGEPVQPAYVGRNAAPVLLVEAGANSSGARLPEHESAWRRDQAGQAQAATLHPQSVESAYRFALTRAPGQPPASHSDLAALILRLRQLPNVIGALATAGIDGVPWPLQPEARAGHVWTVWLSTSTNDEVGANAVAEARSVLSEAGWLASLLPPNWDTSLGWAFGVAGAAGTVLTSADGPALQAAAQKLGGAARERQTLTRVQLLPVARPANHLFLRWNRAALAQAELAPSAGALANALLAGPVAVGTFAGVSVWLTLPKGEMQAEQGSLPLAVRAKGSPREVVLLQDLLQTPPPETTLDRIRVNGAPALAVLAEVAAAQPHLAARALRDTLERAGSLGPVQAWSLTLADPAVAGERSVP